MSLSDLIDPAFSSRLCLTLLHSLWQVALLTLTAALLDRMWKQPSAARNYTVHVTALMIAMAALPMTWLLINSGEAKEAVTVVSVQPQGIPRAVIPVGVPQIIDGPEFDSQRQLPSVPGTETPSTETPSTAPEIYPAIAVASSSGDWHRFATWCV